MKKYNRAYHTFTRIVDYKHPPYVVSIAPSNAYGCIRYMIN